MCTINVNLNQNKIQDEIIIASHTNFATPSSLQIMASSSFSRLWQITLQIHQNQITDSDPGVRSRPQAIYIIGSWVRIPLESQMFGFFYQVLQLRKPG
jgi:hypothetical protein